MTENRKEYLKPDEIQTINAAIYFGGKDYGWEPYVEKKHFVLTNPEIIAEFSPYNLALNFRGTGHFEWELLLAMWMVSAAREALDIGTECDISKVFNIELLVRPKHEGDDYRRLKPEQIREHIGKFFEVIEENENLCKMKVNH